MSEITEQVRDGVGAFWLPRDVVRASGPEAASFLHGQLSQDITGLLFGRSAWSFLLQPQGKVDGFLRVTRLADDDFLLDTEGGHGEAMVARLERFKLRTKIELQPLDWRCLALRGPRASQVAPGLGDAGAVDAGGSIAVDASWPGLPGVDVLGSEPAVPAGVEVLAAEVHEVLRVEAGVPSLGAELVERTIPQEAGVVDRAVSFTKGCYTGQELVARIDSRGHVNKHLRGVVLADEHRPPVGAALHDADGKEVGALTSTASGSSAGAVVALAYVRREVEPPAAVTVVWEGGTGEAEVRSLPLVGG